MALSFGKKKLHMGTSGPSRERAPTWGVLLHEYASSWSPRRWASIPGARRINALRKRYIMARKGTIVNASSCNLVRMRDDHEMLATETAWEPNMILSINLKCGRVVFHPGQNPTHATNNVPRFHYTLHSRRLMHSRKRLDIQKTGILPHFNAGSS